MARITNEVINEIRSKINIVDIISKYVPLIKKGKNYFGVCPFHDDHSPSMSVSVEKQIYTCFSCGASGNVFTFVSEYEHISFIEAVVLLGEKLGYKIDGEIKSDNNDKTDYKIYDLAVKFYQNNLHSSLGKNAIKYLEDRQINRETIKKFGIGLSLSKSGLTELLLAKNYNLEKIVDLGLSNNLGTDLFLNRIMFPLYDLSGNPVGFSARIYNIKDSSKYINTKETNIFKKGNLLYNYHIARQHLKKNEYILIMEGFMDVIRASTIGIDNCVATMGTAFTKQQALIVKKMTDNIVLCFDGDKAGEEATISAIEVLEKMNITPKVIRLEDNMDPDEYILKKGKTAFLSKINQAISVVEFKMQLLKKEKNLTDTKELALYIDDSIKELAKIEDDILVELTLKKISNEHNLEYTTLKNKYNTYKTTKKADPNIVINSKKENKNKSVYDIAQNSIIYYMLKHSEVIEKVEKQITYFPKEEIRYLSNEIICYYHKYGKINEADFITYVQDKPEIIKVLYEIINMNLKDGYTNTEIDDYIKVIKDYLKNTKIKQLEEELKKEVEPLKQAQILKDILSIRGVKQ